MLARHVVQATCLAAQGIAAHCAHLLLHGTLHAQGLDHEDEAEASLMEARERVILTELGFADPCQR